MAMDTDSVKFAMDNLRTAIKAMCVQVDVTKSAIGTGADIVGQNKSEMMANITLGFRHLEDAAMRFGKVIQAADGGESPLGGPSTPIQR